MGRSDRLPMFRHAPPALYLLGLTWQYTRGSALPGWVNDDAEFIAAQVAAAERPVLRRHARGMAVP